MFKIGLLLPTVAAAVWAGPIGTSDGDYSISRLTVEKKRSLTPSRSGQFELEATEGRKEDNLDARLVTINQLPVKNHIYGVGNESSAGDNIKLSEDRLRVLLKQLRVQRNFFRGNLRLLNGLPENETDYHLAYFTSFHVRLASLQKEGGNRLPENPTTTGHRMNFVRRAIDEHSIDADIQKDDATTEPNGGTRRSKRETAEDGKVLRRQKRFFFFWPYLALSSLYWPYLYSGLYTYSPYYYYPYIYYRYPYTLTYGYYPFYVNPTLAVNPAGQPASTPAPAALSAGK